MKNRQVFLILAVMLALGAMLSTAAAAPAASISLEMPPGDTTASAQAAVVIGETVYFSFTPAETGYYSIYPAASADPDSWNEPTLTLYDSDLNELAYENGTFYGDITFEMDAGKLYYIGATVSYGYSPDGLHRFITNIARIQGLISASAGEVTPVHPDQPFTMTVDTQAETGAVLTYQWKVFNPDTGNYEAVPDAADASCTIQHGKRSSYLCAVSDQYGRTKEAYFEIYVDNDLTVDDSASVLVPYGETTVLEVHASCLDGELTYEWYQNWTLIEGATSTSLEILPVTSQTEYECTVHDIYENSASIVFSIGVDNHFRIVGLLINGETVVDADDIRLPPGTPVVAEVQAACDQGELHYSWSDMSGPLPETDQPAFAYGNVREEFAWLNCSIEDIFGNTESVSFQVYLDNGIHATPLTGTVEELTDLDSTAAVKLEPGDSVPLDIEAGCTVGEVYYRWYQIVSDDEGNTVFRPLSGETGHSLIVSAPGRYLCVVYDDYSSPGDEDSYGYGQTVHVLYNVVNNNLVITEPNPDEGAVTVSVTPGDSVTLSVSARVQKGGIHYEWYRYSGEILSRKPSLHLNQFTGKCHYYCKVYDDFENKTILDFKVTASNGLYAAPVFESCFVLPGQNAEFAVHTSVIRGPLTFKWYDPNGNLLPSTSDVATVRAPAERGEYSYICQVKDAYGNKRSVEFCLIVGNAEAITPGQVLDVTPGTAPYSYFTFTPDDTAYYTFTAGGQYVCRLEQFTLSGDVHRRGNDRIFERLYANRTYYYRVETASPSFTATLERIPDILCGNYTLRIGQLVILPAFIGEENLTVYSCESADPPILSVSDHIASAQAAGETLLYAIGDGQQGVYQITVTDPQEGIFILPANLAAIENRAFANVSGIRYAELNEALPVLPAGTFGSADLVQLVIHGKQTVIEDGAFSGTPLILCPEDSQASAYAKEKGLPCFFLAEDD